MSGTGPAPDRLGGLATADLVALVVERLLGDGSLPLQVHRGEFVDEAEVAELLDAMRALVGRFTDQPSVPKELALATVSAVSRFENVHYPQEQQERLEDIGLEVERLAEEIFTT